MSVCSSFVLGNLISEFSANSLSFLFEALLLGLVTPSLLNRDVEKRFSAPRCFFWSRVSGRFGL